MKHGHRVLIGALATVVLAVTLVLLAAGGQSALAGGATIYVDTDATGLNNGGSWRHAFTDLQDALDEAEPLDQIWVAAGTYKPSRQFIDDDPRSATFQMVNGVAIYGGFDPDAGVTKFEHRDWVTHVTVLSGNIGDEDLETDNSYHVFYHPEGLALNSSAILDGFIITAGNADQEDPSGIRGGGMLNEGSSPALNNITFVGNSAGYGGALWVSAPFPEEATVALTNVTFAGNSAANGGAMYVALDVPPGAVTDPPVRLTNCTFWGNAAELGGGLFITYGELDDYTPPVRLTNCTFWGNQAEVGGAVYTLGPVTSVVPLMLTNSILWGDTAGGLPNEIHAEDPENPPLVTYSDVEGGYDGEGNIDLDPEFVDPDSGDLHLQPGSVCIDSANNGPELAQYDFEGDLRILDGDGDGWAVVDMGVDEFKMPTILVKIDVTPYIPNNVIRVRSWVLVDVAILTTEEFDAADVVPDTVLFAGAPSRVPDWDDVDGDGDLDLLLYFSAREMVELDEDSTEATLTGETQEGVHIEGTDEVTVR